MDDELPSFSLGLDSGCDSPGDGEDFESADQPARTLRRLRHRRGLRRSPASSSPAANIDDDIDEFSLGEEICGIRKPSVQFGSMCRSSKLQLSKGSRSIAKPKQPSNGAVSNSQQACSSSRPFQTSTVNCILVDSDHVLAGEEARNTGNGVPSRGKTRASPGNPSIDDLWKDFNPMKSTCVRTTAFDKFCNEHFHPEKNKKDQSRKPEICSVSGDDEAFIRTGNGNDLPPSHQYFFHDDPKIWILAMSRLPHFFPLAGNPLDCQHLRTSAIDYMSQFNHGEPSQQRGTRKVAKKGSGARGNSVASNAEEPMCDGWVNPRRSVTLPANAGKRRVQATGKVYVAVNGHDFTGSAAYRNYKRESGTAFRKLRNKRNTRRPSVDDEQLH